MEVDGVKLLKQLVNRWYLILLSAILTGSVAYVCAVYVIPPVYEAYVTMYVENTSNHTGNISISDIDTAQSLLNTYVVLLSSDTILKEVSAESGLNYSVKQIREMIAGSSVDKTQLLRVSVRNTSAADAMRIAEAIGRIAPMEIIRIVKAGNVEIVDRATLAEKPYFPNVTLFTLLGTCGGLLLCCLVLVMKEFLDSRIKSEKDIQQNLSATLIGVIPAITADARGQKRRFKGKAIRKPATLLTEEVSPVVSEAYSMARTNLSFLLSAQKKKSILFTSALPAEGKSTTCANLAISLAATGKKILIIDADMRNPQMHRMFGVAASPGLSDILGGFTDVDCIQMSRFEKLSILSAGTIPPNPADFLALTTFSELLERLLPKYDYIFMDTPPVNLFTDAVSASSKIESVVLVAKYASTRMDMLKSCMDKFHIVDANVIGILLNGVESQKYREQTGSDRQGKYYNTYPQG